MNEITYQIRPEFWGMVFYAYLSENTVDSFEYNITESDIRSEVTLSNNNISAEFIGPFTEGKFKSIIGTTVTGLIVFYANIDINLNNVTINKITFKFNRTFTDLGVDYNPEVFEFTEHNHDYIKSDFDYVPKFNILKGSNLNDYGKLFTDGYPIDVTGDFSSLDESKLYVYGRDSSGKLGLIEVDDASGIFNVNFKYEPLPSHLDIDSSLLNGNKITYRGNTILINTPDKSYYIKDGEQHEPGNKILALLDEDRVIYEDGLYLGEYSDDTGFDSVNLYMPVNVIIYRSAFKLYNGKLKLVL